MAAFFLAAVGGQAGGCQELFGGVAIVDVEFDLPGAGECVLDGVLVGDVHAVARVPDADEPGITSP